MQREIDEYSDRQIKDILELNEYSDAQLKYSFGYTQEHIDHLREIAEQVA